MHSGRILVVAVAIGAGLIATAVQAQPAKARRAELIYLLREDCGSCHGLTLKGGLGSPLLPKNLKDQSVGTIAKIILDGVPGTPMPPWRPMITPDEAAWMAAKLKDGRLDP